MQTFTLRIIVVVLAFTVGTVVNAIVNRSTLVETSLTYVMKSTRIIGVKQTDLRPKEIAFDPSLPTEITLQRVCTWCKGCPRKIILRTSGWSDFEEAAVTEIDLKTNYERHGTLDPYHHRNLIRLIESQGYFDMADQYGEWWDATVVTSSVKIGDRYKRITTDNEGEVPLALWGIHYAIEGVVHHVSWDTDK